MEGRLTRRDFLKVGGGTFAGACILGLAGCGGRAGGQGSSGSAGWKPNRNVEMDVPFSPGGGSDVFGRALASGIEQVRSGVNINVNNRSGGSGVTGYSYLLNHKGDPYILLASESGAGVALPIAQEVPYTWKDFTPIAEVAEDHTMIIVPSGSRFKTLKDMVKAAGQGKVTVGVSGKTGTDAIAFNLIAQKEGVKFDQVVFQSGGEISTALLGGDIDAAGSNPSESIGQLKADKLRALALLSEKRFSSGLLSRVPTAAEQGVNIDVTPTLQYRGPFAAGGITGDQRAYWEKATVAWTKTKDYKKYINNNYLTSTIRTGQDFEDFLAKQQRAIKAALKKS